LNIAFLPISGQCKTIRFGETNVAPPGFFGE
jgi:hypothetical protein